MRASKTQELKGPGPWPHIRLLHSHTSATRRRQFSLKVMFGSPLFPCWICYTLGLFKICLSVYPPPPPATANVNFGLHSGMASRVRI